MSEKILDARNISRRYGPGCPDCERLMERNYCPACGTVHALKGVSFDVHEGEILGIVGESGSGKSTLMQCLYFDLEATGGELFIAGYGDGKANALTASGQAKRHIRNTLFGKVYQNPMLGLKMDFSAVSNVAEKLIAAGWRNAGKMEERARSLLEHVNIPQYRIREAPRNFSGGMQQRVQIARALSNDPPILLLDEVTTGLDLSVQAKVLDLVKNIQRELGVTMILVSHDLGVIRTLADRTIVMLDGAVVESGLTDQILEDPQDPYTQELVHSLL